MEQQTGLTHSPARREPPAGKPLDSRRDPRPRDGRRRSAGDGGERDETLREAETGRDYVVTDVTLDARHAFRLAELGIRPGVRVLVMQHGGFGGRVVAVGSERIALDGETAAAVTVRGIGESDGVSSAAGRANRANGARDGRCAEGGAASHGATGAGTNTEDDDK